MFVPHIAIAWIAEQNPTVSNLTNQARSGKASLVSDSDAGTGKREACRSLEVGHEVDMPLRSDPRLKNMRTSYIEKVMAGHCGRVGKVDLSDAQTTIRSH